MQQLHGIAYTHSQSLDCHYNGSIAYQARQQKRKDNEVLERELDRLESLVMTSPLEDERINEIYELLCS